MQSFFRLSTDKTFYRSKFHIFLEIIKKPRLLFDHLTEAEKRLKYGYAAKS